jgi:hypothetical protein
MSSGFFNAEAQRTQSFFCTAALPINKPPRLCVSVVKNLSELIF